MYGLDTNKNEKIGGLLPNIDKPGTRSGNSNLEKTRSEDFQRVMQKKAANEESKNKADLAKSSITSSTEKIDKGTTPSNESIQKLLVEKGIIEKKLIEKKNVVDKPVQGKVTKTGELEVAEGGTLNVLGELSRLLEGQKLKQVDKKEEIDALRMLNKMKSDKPMQKSDAQEEAKQLHQIATLKALARELTKINLGDGVQDLSAEEKLNLSTKGKNAAKELVTTIQLQIQSDKNTVKHEAQNTTPFEKLMKSDSPINDLKFGGTKGEVKEKIVISDIKSEATNLHMSQESVFKNEALKVNTLKEVIEVVSSGVEEYVSMKVVNSKKIVLHVNQDNIGRMEIQIEKKGETIHILVKTEDKVTKEKIESSMESLKLNLEDKKVEITYKVEKESDKEEKEKRKEQEEFAKKENKREQSGKDRELKDQFEEMMGVEY